MNFAVLMAMCTIAGLLFAVLGLVVHIFEDSIVLNVPSLRAMVDNALAWIIGGGVGIPVAGYAVACMLKPFITIVGI